MLLKEHDLWDHASKVIPKLTYPTDLTTHEKDIKAQRVIMDVVKDHLIYNIVEKRCQLDILEL